MSKPMYKAKIPIEGNWREVKPHVPPDPLVIEVRRFETALGVTVISSVDMIEGAPQFHVSLSLNGKRIPASIVPVILKQFGADGWDEDNHTPFGQVRHFWLPIASDLPKICPCKQVETPVIEGDYIWRAK